MVCTTGVAAAASVDEEVAGQSVTIIVLEKQTRHNHQETDTSSYTFHEERYENRVSVNDDEVAIVVYNRTRTSDRSGAFEIHREEQEYGVLVDGEIQGVRTAKAFSVTYIENEFDVEDGPAGQTQFVVVDGSSNTYTDDRQVRADLGWSTGTGYLENSSINPDGPVGRIYFVNGGGSGSLAARDGDTSARGDAGAFADAFAGDYNAVLADAGGAVTACEGFDCQRYGANEDVCVLGYRPPVFLACVPPR